MRSRRVVVLAIVLGLRLTPCVVAAQRASPDPESAEAKTARLAWFREAKFGLFIHWGLYAIPAGRVEGQARVPGIGEWIMNRAKIPVARVRGARRAVQPGEVRRRGLGARSPRTRA